MHNILKSLILLISITTISSAQSRPVQFDDLKAETHFILVMDRSGSMSGSAIHDARIAVKNFVGDMQPADRAAILEFGSDISILQKMTSSKSSLYTAADRLRASGGTRLYDAIGRALLEVKDDESAAVVIFMTDGQDGSSSLTISDLANMCPSQGVLVYGIGLGDADQNSLRKIARATGGEIEYSTNSANLSDIYLRVQKSYYERIGNRLQTLSQLIVRSIPQGQPVIVNGQKRGMTPLLLTDLQPGDYDVNVEFRGGTWKQNFTLPVGKRAFLDARESDIPKNIAILSTPHNGMTFIDGQFVGYTSSFLLKKNKTKKGFIFKREIVREDFSRELIVPAVAQGNHTLKIVAVSDDGFENFFAPLSYTFHMGDKNLIINADCRTGEVESSETDAVLKPGGRQPTDPFKELDDEFGDDSDPDFN